MIDVRDIQQRTPAVVPAILWNCGIVTGNEVLYWYYTIRDLPAENRRSRNNEMGNSAASIALYLIENCIYLFFIAETGSSYVIISFDNFELYLIIISN
jgi:hypothetical protein